MVYIPYYQKIWESQFLLYLSPSSSSSSVSTLSSDISAVMLTLIATDGGKADVTPDILLTDLYIFRDVSEPYSISVSISEDALGILLFNR